MLIPISKRRDWIGLKMFSGREERSGRGSRWIWLFMVGVVLCWFVEVRREMVFA